MATATEVLTRGHAGVFDLRTEGPSENRGCCPGSEYIGGSGGVSWYEYFVDSKTGETYRVSCWDGVEGGKSAHSERDEEWLGRCFAEVVTRCHQEADSGKTEIRISRNERAVMQGKVHKLWLESAPGKFDGEQSTEGLSGGFVGYSHGVPVICDLEKEDLFPPRIGERAVKDALASAERHPSHPYAQQDEVFIGDRQIPVMSDSIPWKTKRLGPSSRGTHGRLGRHVPIFIKKSELDEAVEALRKWEARSK